MKKIVLISFLFVNLLYVNLSASNVLENDRQKSTKEESFLLNLFKNLDKGQLQSKDEAVVKKYLIDKNIAIKEYLIKTYPDKEFEQIEVDDAGTFFIGLMTAIAEENNYMPINNKETKSGSLNINCNSTTKLPPWAACTMEVIAGVFDVVSLYNQYVELFTGSASWTTVAKVLRKTLSRHFGWIALAYLVYDVGNTCF